MWNLVLRSPDEPGRWEEISHKNLRGFYHIFQLLVWIDFVHIISPKAKIIVKIVETLLYLWKIRQWYGEAMEEGILSNQKYIDKTP